MKKAGGYVAAMQCEISVDVVIGFNCLACLACLGSGGEEKMEMIRDGLKRIGY